MEKLKNCPFCGGETILCQMQTGFSLCMEFSIICLNCGIEFKQRKDPSENMAQYAYNPGKLAQEVIEKFNKRHGEG